MLSVNNDEFMFEQKYRPQTIDECILPKLDKDIFLNLIKTGRIPHLILHSVSPGTGKTTVAKCLVNQTNAEYMFVKGSDCLIDFIRGPLTRFATSKSIEGKHKVIIIDEYDRAGLADAQRHLRSFMESYSNNCSVIITANNLQGIITPLQSRARVITFGQASKSDRREMMKQMILRITKICESENIEIKDLKVVAKLVSENFPDFRKTINELDRYSTGKVLDTGILSAITKSSDTQDVIEALKAKNIKELRSLSIKYAPVYKEFILQLANDLYPIVKPVSIIPMYEIIGENNKFYGLAANIELHLMHMFATLLVELQWNV